MEKRGEGVPIILDNSEQLSGRMPEYRLIDDEELLLTIHAAQGEAPAPHVGGTGVKYAPALLPVCRVLDSGWPAGVSGDRGTNKLA